ncbi:MAG TPA: hypothetical protein VJ844_02515 [Mucilaginibacter sp.]|nr:hypothetical protein [Mucilaginibacter sp.]
MLNYNSLKYKGDLLVSGAPASTSVSPQINAGIDIFPYKAVQKLYFRVELGFSYRQFNFNHREEFSTPTGATIILDVKQYNAILSPQLVYNLYNTEKLKVFIDAGVAVNKSFYNDYKLITKYDSFSPSVQSHYPNFSSLWITFPVKAGVAVGKKVEVYFNYMPSKIISDSKTAAFFGTLSSYGAGLNYYFGGK